MEPTPETDAAIVHVHDPEATRLAGKNVTGVSRRWVHPSLARKLERERNQARAEAERWRDNWKNGRTMAMIVSTELPWENVKAMSLPADSALRLRG